MKTILTADIFAASLLASAVTEMGFPSKPATR